MAANLLFCQSPYTHTCITYTAVNEAFLTASEKTAIVSRPKGAWKPEDIAPLGEVLLHTTRILAQRFRLSQQEVWSALPQLDTRKTIIAKHCPDFASSLRCIPSKYRRHDGLCNNLYVPTFASTRSVFSRLVPPAYSDGVGDPRVSVVRGEHLPSPRAVSATVHRDKGFHDHAITLYVVAWGQFMDHDFTLTATPLDPMTRNEPGGCCQPSTANQTNPLCLPIHLPPNDPFYSTFGQSCMDFVRAFSGVRMDCRLGVRAPFNVQAGVIDANTVYGSDPVLARKLRLLRGGLMKMNNTLSSLGLKELLPLKLDWPDEGCLRSFPNQYCFEAGDIRVNEQLILTTMHTLWFREHNRLAKSLSRLNPHWNDETLYQETRRIVVAQIQHITFKEFLPLLLGEDVMKQYDLILRRTGYWDGYNPSTDPSMTVAFISAAFRFGHSLLPSAVERWSASHKFIASTRLSRLIRQPWDLFRAGVLDQYYVGLMNQPAQAVDDAVTQEVTNHLFEPPEKNFGIDLVSLNLQRGREMGLPGYTTYRRYCGLPAIYTFDQLGLYMSNFTAQRYKKLYSHVDDIDLWSAGVSERPLAGSLLGPTFTCIVATQMQRLKYGDRYWYELPGQPSSLTLQTRECHVRAASFLTLI
ncbi:Chorion peroxidase-like 8 [Homarus americanus]|uniref:Chorion peroxidase-like 8 n=1 Tax=Homarus americanus TaxID=6706 RepID=A0A8J5K535_HOMAM|nr:Chorion peroxidase-like 8 [Homarus americanus]